MFDICLNSILLGIFYIIYSIILFFYSIIKIKNKLGDKLLNQIKKKVFFLLMFRTPLFY